MLCWTIWWSRNLKLAKQAVLLPLQVVEFAQTYLSAFTTPSSKQVSSRFGLQSFWYPPLVGCVKINFDGALLEGGRVLGLGAIARDFEGRCLAWLSLRLARGGSTEMAEAFATREGVFLALRFQWQQVIFEGDCRPLMNQLSSAEQVFSVTSPVLEDIRVVSSHSENVSFSFVLRSGNAAADLLAKLALNQEGDSSSLPPGLGAVISGDLAN
ncbi:UNVERIFIED_CONTAM: hypothetical protein Slati_1969600 [Sesamum latifolium]|uniref:RNase H type-1 domain-containing protein n=1 Tax=Sesamum latifolium TaxID=2727402 RepID=A0AAW2WMW3_9LAMI